MWTIAKCLKWVFSVTISSLMNGTVLLLTGVVAAAAYDAGYVSIPLVLVVFALWEAVLALLKR